jgi:cation diffusion facilitator CzcD-associated flavoprotein CzcO
MGGTWDLFRYPGIRSDSDMYTLGYEFKPWRDGKAIADGPSIRAYVEEAAKERGIDGQIRYGHKLLRAEWSSPRSRWLLEIGRGDGRAPVKLACKFLWMCSGYYSYAQGHRPTFPGEDQFRGPILQPQFWPELLDYRGKRIVVIGSGATAVTLVPEMARQAAHVTMLQRSPTYVVSRPAVDPIAERLKRRLPAMLAYRLVRTKNVLLQQFFYRMARKWPQRVAQRMVQMAAAELPPGYDTAHFTPRYNPWDQRVCLVPDADLFRAISAGTASVVTETIATFTPTGIRLASGRELEADIVVAATGLQLNLLGDVQLAVDGRRCELSRALVYKGMMFSGVPNLASTFGYTNASWTLKADLTARYVCRLLARMDAKGQAVAVPVREPGVGEQPFIDFSSGYVRRAVDLLPKQGDRKPWRLAQNYMVDLAALRYSPLKDRALHFVRQGQPLPS